MTECDMWAKLDQTNPESDDMNQMTPPPWHPTPNSQITDSKLRACMVWGRTTSRLRELPTILGFRCNQGPSRPIRCLRYIVTCTRIRAMTTNRAPDSDDFFQVSKAFSYTCLSQHGSAVLAGPGLPHRNPWWPALDKLCQFLESTCQNDMW